MFTIILIYKHIDRNVNGERQDHTNSGTFKLPITPDIYPNSKIQTVTGCALAYLHLHFYIDVSSVLLLTQRVLLLCLFGHVISSFWGNRSMMSIFMNIIQH